MDVRYTLPVKWVWLLLSFLALSLSLVACGDATPTTNSGDATPTTAVSTPTSVPSPTPSPTPAVKTYSGDGYTFDYPQDWAVTNQGGVIQFAPKGGDQALTFSIRSADYDNTPGTPGVSLDQQLAIEGNTLTGYQDYKSDETVPATTAIGGDNWKGYGGTYNDSGKQIKAVILGDQHPARTGKIFIIHLTAPTASYDQANSTIFQPLFQSFKFS